MSQLVLLKRMARPVKLCVPEMPEMPEIMYLNCFAKVHIRHTHGRVVSGRGSSLFDDDSAALK